MGKIWNEHTKIVLPCAAVMLFLPLLASFLPGKAVFAIAVLLFMAVDPLSALCIGIAAGRHIRRLWYVPLLTAALYWVGAALFITGGNTTIWVYAVAYLLIGTAAMWASHGIRYFLRKKRAGR